MAIDPQHPGDFAWDLFVEIDQRGRELVEFGAPFGQQQGLPGVEENLRLEHETVADDANIGPVAENRTQPSKKLRRIARQFLSPLRPVARARPARPAAANPS